MRTLRSVLAVALCTVLAAGLAACSGGDDPQAGPRAAPTAISQLDGARMRVVRVAFCDLVPKKAVRAALAATPTRARSWRAGAPVREAGGEIGQEFGCAWFGPHARVARAWVFARAVNPAFARSLVRRAGQERGCRAGSGPGFGTPSLVQTCLRDDSPRRIRHAGLFGSSWLSCEISGHGPAAALRARADAWCVSVATALNAGQASSS